MNYRRLIKRLVPAVVLIGLGAFIAGSLLPVNGSELSSGNPQAVRLYEEGLKLVDQDKFEPAVDKFRQAIKLDQGFLRAHFRYIDVSRGMGKGEQIVEEYRARAEENPKSALDLYLYGRALENLAEKRAQYRAALEIDTGFYWAQYGIGGIYLVQRRYDEAIIALNKTLEMNPKMVEAIHLIGTVYLEKGMLIQARERFEEAAAIDSSNQMVYMSLGQVYSQMDQFESAEKSFRKAASLSPNNPMAYYYIGLVCEMQGRSEQAVVAYEMFLRLDPDHELASMVENNIKKLRK